MSNPGVVAAIHVAGVRGDPCGAMRCNALHHKGHHVHVLLPQHRDCSLGF